MGARAREHKIELFLNARVFNKRVGLVKNYYEIEWLGLTGHDFCGSFGRSCLPQLIQFCKDNPEYHIVSCDGPGRYINRLVAHQSFYMIGDGDKDPNLVLNSLLDPQWQVLYEDGVSSGLAEFDNIKNRRKA